MSTPQVLQLAVVSAGTSDPSSTRLLADRVAERAAALAEDRGRTMAVTVIELRELAGDIAAALVSQLVSPALAAAIITLGEADGVILSTPVYKAAPSGLFTSFLDILDDDLLIGTPVLLAASAGSPRHALVADDQMRPMLAYLRALSVPTSLFAAPQDWADPALGERIGRAAGELELLMETGFAAAVRAGGTGSYRHEFGSAAAADDIQLDTDLMRLATGGSAA